MIPSLPVGQIPSMTSGPAISGPAENRSVNILGGPSNSTTELLRLAGLLRGGSKNGGITEDLFGVDQISTIRRASPASSWLPWIAVGGLALVFLWKLK